MRYFPHAFSSPELEKEFQVNTWSSSRPSISNSGLAVYIWRPRLLFMYNDDFLELRNRLVQRQFNTDYDAAAATPLLAMDQPSNPFVTISAACQTSSTPLGDDNAESSSTATTNLSNPAAAASAYSQSLQPFFQDCNPSMPIRQSSSTNPFLHDAQARMMGNFPALHVQHAQPAHPMANTVNHGPVPVHPANFGPTPLPSGPALPPVPKPAPYNGREDFDDFLVRIGAHLGRFPGLKDVDKINTLTAFLGPAFTTYTTWLAMQCVYYGLPPGSTVNQLPGLRYEGLVEHLRSRHGSVKSAALLRREFRARHRRPEESFETFVTELQRLAARAHPDPGAQRYAQQTVVEQFMHGLNDSYVTERLLNHPTPPGTIEEALRFAQQLRETRTFMQTTGGRGSNTETQHRPPPRPPAPPRPSGWGQQQQQQAATGPVCFGCGQQGHIRRNCPNAEGAGPRGQHRPSQH